MEPLQCSGTCALTGLPIQLAFQDAIHSVTPSAETSNLYLAPGFIDLQVNGFAGVDYNHPRTPHEDIARSLRAQFATGVTRLRSEEHTSALQSRRYLHSFPTRRSSDLQAKGFAGVDYNPPRTPPEDIARSLRAQFATGVARL